MNRSALGRVLACGALLAAGGFGADRATADDWPMWRHDAGRSAASAASLPRTLRPAWDRSLPALVPAWPDQPKMQVDAAYRPIVLGRRMFVASSHDDSLAAYDTRTGEVLWRLHASGPFRMPPAAAGDLVYAAGDDGVLHAVEAQTGRVRWSFRGGPRERRVLGNGRLIDTWPARGGPVVQDGTVWFGAGIWPFMGIFLHALDAETGAVEWTNDGDGSLYMKQPHNTDSFAGVAPQGPLVVSGGRLFVPGGRSVPAAFDKETGRLLHYALAENGKRGGGSVVSAVGPVVFNGAASFDATNGKSLGGFGELVAFRGGLIVEARDGKLVVGDFAKAGVANVEVVDSKGKKSKESRWTPRPVAEGRTLKATDAILVGDRVYVGGKDAIEVWELPRDALAVASQPSPAVPAIASPNATPASTATGSPSSDAKKVEDAKKPDEGVSKSDDAKKPDVPPPAPLGLVQRIPIEGTVASLLAADDRLFAVTTAGRILAFAGEAGTVRVHAARPEPAKVPAREADPDVRDLLDAASGTEGFAVVWGLEDGRLLRALSDRTKLHVVGLDDDAERVARLRRELADEGRSAARITVLHGDLDAFPWPKYLATLVAFERLPAARETDREFWDRVFDVLRPFGGTACVPVGEERRSVVLERLRACGLPGSRLEASARHVLLRRSGPLPGSADWTHEHADAANSRVSRDGLVKAPLGLLWFGGSSHEGILPRHGHGPQPQVIDGRLLIEGVDLLRALDIYTGRVLWEAKLPGLGKAYDNTAHQPGANSIGSNYASTSDGIYVAYGTKCLRLDPETGRVLREFVLNPLPGTKGAPRWGHVSIAGDRLIAAIDPIVNPEAVALPATAGSGDDDDPKLKEQLKKAAAAKSSDDTGSASRRIVVLDRHTGAVQWSQTARDAFRHNAICAGGGRLYALDRVSGPHVARLRRRGLEPPHAPTVRAFDLTTGHPLWTFDRGVFGTWLSWSAERDVLIESGRVARDTLNDEPKGMRAFRAADGFVLWEGSQTGPPMLLGDRVLLSGSGCDLLSGRATQRTCPLTGSSVPWAWTRNYGCNTPMASEHLLTFRSGAAGYFDLAEDGGTGNFGGFRSSCTNNLVVAGGVLTAPDYTRTCTCSYQNQTSLGLIHDPEAERWTSFGTARGTGPVRRVGVNLNAPGDRKSADGTLWLEAPSIGGSSPAVGLRLDPAKPAGFRRHESQVQSASGHAFVAASGLVGLKGIEVQLATATTDERLHTVRLHFAEPDATVRPGERVFDVDVPGAGGPLRIDVVAETGGALRGLVKELRNVPARDKLTIVLRPAPGVRRAEPVLCGVEIRCNDPFPVGAGEERESGSE